jgi:cation diffusion facilitator family transporter
MKPTASPQPTLHTHDLTPFAHSHSFADAGQSERERALATVTWVTLATMVLELAVGWWSASLALTADGWHMGTHALALGGAVLAYRLSRRAGAQRGHNHSHDPAPAHVQAHTHEAPHAHAHTPAQRQAGFAFGGWKIEVLTAYTSGLVLLGVAAWLAWEGVDTLRHPKPVAYGEALVVAVVGLLVNLLSVWLLSRGAGAAHAHGPGHGHEHAHHDHNFSAAYIHVMADAFTSLLAIAALSGGFWFGLRWLDPAVALLGAAVIAQWSYSVLRSSARALVDATEDPALARRVRELIEADGDAKLADLHVWQVGAKAWCAALSVVADAPLAASVYRQRLHEVVQLRHVTVEVHGCLGAPAVATSS